jgi:hypothetical protein
VINRLVALVGTLALAVALVLLWVARARIPYDVYVSELGAPGMPTARVFEAVLLLIAAGAVLLAWAGRGIRSRARVFRWWPPSISLAAAGAFFFVDSQVSCTPGCPVPVGPTFTLEDFVHTFAAVLAFAFASWAIMQCAFAIGHPVLSRISAAGAIAVAAASTAGGLMSLLHFEAIWGSRLEWAATTIGLAWVVVFGVSLVRWPSAPHGSAPHRSATHQHEKLVGQVDQPVDLVLVPVHPPALGLSPHRDEGVVLLPDDERPLGA